MPKVETSPEKPKPKSEVEKPKPKPKEEKPKPKPNEEKPKPKPEAKKPRMEEKEKPLVEDDDAENGSMDDAMRAELGLSPKNKDASPEESPEFRQSKQFKIGDDGFPDSDHN